MKYLNKNIEEIGKKSNENSLVNHTTPYGLSEKKDFYNMNIKDNLPNGKAL